LILRKPIDRIMEQLGSKTNFDVFRLMSQSLNKLKGDVGVLIHQSTISY
jgi:hypothetical protein